MARRPRLSFAGELHYVLQTGHNGQAVFADDADREAFLAMLRDAARAAGVAVHAYALLDDAVHLLAVPARSEALGRLMQSLGRQYVAAYNRRHGRSGSLWAGRFRCAPIDATAWGYAAMLEIESAPVAKGLAADAGTYAWSSAGHHLGRRRDPLITDHSAYWAIGNTPFERELVHANHLNDARPARSLTFVVAAHQGRPVGDAAFVDRLSAHGRVLPHALRRGRPRRLASKKTVPN